MDEPASGADPCGERFLDARLGVAPVLVDCETCGVPHWWCSTCAQAACAHVVDAVARAAGALAPPSPPGTP